MTCTSLRVRLLIAAAACVIVTVAVAGWLLVGLFERQVLRMIGEDLDLRWEEFNRALSIGPNGQAELSPPPNEPRFYTPRSGAYWQISEKGAVVAKSPSLDGETIETTGHDEERRTGKWFEVVTQDMGELYVLERDVTTMADGTPRRLRLTVALDHDGVATARDGFQRDVVLVLGLLAILLIAAAALQLWLTLDPLKRLGRELTAIRGGEKARFQSVFPSEIAPLAEDLNLLLDRQEAMVVKARERAGSLAHGLKTPLAILSAEARRLTSERKSEIAERIEEQVQCMQTHVERELARARTQGASAGIGAHVDAEKSIERLIRVMSRLPRGDMLTWRWEVSAGLTLKMDPDDFGEILGNLLDNARKWASSAVTLECEAVGPAVRISVTDDGPGFNAIDARPVTVDGERHNSAGLGLTIVRDVLVAYGAELTIDRLAPHGAVSFEARAANPAATHLPTAFGLKTARSSREIKRISRVEDASRNVVPFGPNGVHKVEARPR